MNCEGEAEGERGELPVLETDRMSAQRSIDIRVRVELNSIA
jgi:hypothetical protein